jgi:hypothetical protein
LKRLILFALIAAAYIFDACAPTTRATTAERGGSSATVARSPREQWLGMFARGYFPGRSGQVFVVSKEGDFVTYRDPLYRFMHGSPHDYDSHIPLLFHGAAFITPGVYAQPAQQQDIAPTIGAIIGAPTLSTYTGRVLHEAIGTGAARPRIVSVIVLDAMRADYFDRHADVMPALTRLRKAGAWFAETRTTVIPTVTGVGHANIGTGSDPRIHGIAVNALFNRITGKSQEAYDQLETRELMALTLADAWNVATDGQAVIIGHGGAIRATAGLVGHGSCLIAARKVIAASYGGADGGWETNPACYTMPPALKQFTGRKVWEAAGGTWMGHDIASASKFRASSLFQKYEAEALRAVVDESAVGADEITDLIMVNMKGPDYTAHAHGPESKEQRETLAELDRQMAAYVALIEKKAGPGRSLLIITADHGMPAEPSAPRRRIFFDEVVALLNKKFDPEGKLVQYYNDPANNQMYVDAARLKSLGLTLKDVAAFLEADLFAAAFTEDEVRAAQRGLK